MVHPPSLQRLTAIVTTKHILRSSRNLYLSNKSDVERLLQLLKFIFMEYPGILMYRSIQQQLNHQLLVSIRSYCNSTANLILMVFFCPAVIIDQIARVDKGLLEPGVSNTGLDLNVFECESIYYLLKTLDSLKIENKLAFEFPTVRLVLEGVYFHQQRLLPDILSRMPQLTHVLLQHNINVETLQIIVKCCPKLESLVLTEGAFDCAVREDSFVHLLFGQKLHPKKALEYFREKKQPPLQSCLPFLIHIDVDELYMEEESLVDLYLLFLLLQPCLESFGRHTGFTSSMCTQYHDLAVVRDAPNLPILSCSKLKFTDMMIDDEPLLSPDSEISFLSSVLHMFKNLKSVELSKLNWSKTNIARFCHLFKEIIESLSLCDLPLHDLTCLNNLSHLRLAYTHSYSFQDVHIILDNCPALKTLSVHPILQKHHRTNNNHNNDVQLELEDLDLILDDERYIVNQLLQIGQGHGYNLLNEEAPIHQPVPAHIYNQRFYGAPAEPNRPVSRKNPKPHDNLRTLRIASLIEASPVDAQEEFGNLLHRLVKLERLCLGLWLGSIRIRQNQVLCSTTDILLNVLSASRNPLLPNLYQVCGLPTATQENTGDVLWQFVQLLPSLHTLVLPALAPIVLGPIEKEFQHTNINIQHKCNSEQVFSHWEPDH